MRADYGNEFMSDKDVCGLLVCKTNISEVIPYNITNYLQLRGGIGPDRSIGASTEIKINTREAL